MPLRLPTFLALAAFPILASLTPGLAEPLAPESILGHYRIAGGAVMAIADCGGQICGRIVMPGTPDQRAQSAATAMACGLTVLTDLHPNADGWQGRFHDPSRGEYVLNLWRANTTPGAALLTERYNAPPFLTRTMPQLETWTSVAAPAAACDPVAPTS